MASNEQCRAEGCDDKVKMWVEFGPAPVMVGLCERCGKEVV